MVARFRQRLIAGETLVGTIVSVESPEIVEVLCHIGFDWLFIETEHSPLSPAAVQRIIQIAGDTACIVRLPGGDEVSIKRALDAGAAGFIVPQINGFRTFRKGDLYYSKFENRRYTYHGELTVTPLM